MGLGPKRGGYFVEFGAASGVHLSNTWLLEKKMGWNGILAEPNPVFLDSLQTRRTCAVSAKCVYPRSGETLDFLATDIAEYSRISSIPAGDVKEAERSENARTVQVQTISLNDLLIEHGAPEIIDYLSVDTEGSELAILSAFDFDRWDARSISVEHNFTSNRGGLCAAFGPGVPPAMDGDQPVRRLVCEGPLSFDAGPRPSPRRA